MFNAAQFVDVLLEMGAENADDMMGDFVTGALAKTDPLIGLDSHHVMSTGMIEAWHHHTGAHWKGRIQFTYDPRNGDFSVYATMEHPTSYHAAIQGSSYWGVTPDDLPLIQQAIKKLVIAFNKVTDIPPSTPAHPSPVRAAFDEALLVLDSVFAHGGGDTYPRV